MTQSPCGSVEDTVQYIFTPWSHLSNSRSPKMHHHQKEYQQAPLRNDGVPVDPRVQQGDVYNQTGQYPQEVGRQPGQVYSNAMPPHNFVGNAGRDQVSAQDPQSGYGTTNAVTDK